MQNATNFFSLLKTLIFNNYKLIWIFRIPIKGFFTLAFLLYLQIPHDDAEDDITCENVVFECSRSQATSSQGHASDHCPTFSNRIIVFSWVQSGHSIKAAHSVNFIIHSDNSKTAPATQHGYGTVPIVCQGIKNINGLQTRMAIESSDHINFFM